MDRSLSLFSIAFLLTAAHARAQNLNTQMLAHIDRFPGAVAPNNNYAGCWGLVSNVNGKEYAIITARAGTVIYDISIATAPVERAFITGPTTTGQYVWREAQTYGNYVYLSSEHGALQVIDMSNPDSPTLVGTFGGTAHTVTIDAATGTLVSNGGAANGMRFYNLLASLTNPPLIGSSGNPYVHDSYLYNGYLYTAEIFNGTMAIYAFQKSPFLLTLQSRLTTPGAFTHNVWTNPKSTLAITADENMGGCLTLYNVTNKQSPSQVGTWCSPNGATVHNVMIDYQVAHFSCYTDGYWALDVTNQAAPQPIAHFDTSTYAGNDYIGCWAVYPFLPSGNVICCDMQSGFWLVRPTCGVPLRYGNATAGTGGLKPTVDFKGGFAKVNRPTFGIQSEDMLPSATALLILGLGQASIPVLGIELAVDPTRPIFFLPVATDPAGKAATTIGIPNDPLLAGGTLYFQWAVLDAGGPQGLSASQGMKVTICP